MEVETAPINLLKFPIIIYGSQLNFNRECGYIESPDFHEPDESTNCNRPPLLSATSSTMTCWGNLHLLSSDHLRLLGQLPIRVHDQFPFISFNIKGSRSARRPVLPPLQAGRAPKELGGIRNLQAYRRGVDQAVDQKKATESQSNDILNKKMAERSGFEPETEVYPLYSLSRRAPSANSAISPQPRYAQQVAIRATLLALSE